MEKSNKNLTAANMHQVQALVQNLTIKHAWQAHRMSRGTVSADAMVCRNYGYPMTTVKAARFYW